MCESQKKTEGRGESIRPENSPKKQRLKEVPVNIPMAGTKPYNGTGDRGHTEGERERQREAGRRAKQGTGTEPRKRSLRVNKSPCTLPLSLSAHSN